MLLIRAHSRQHFPHNKRGLPLCLVYCTFSLHYRRLLRAVLCARAPSLPNAGRTNNRMHMYMYARISGGTIIFILTIIILFDSTRNDKSI